jgi:hypothetical protein
MQPFITKLGKRLSTATGGDQEFYGGEPPFMPAILPQVWNTPFGITDSDLKGPGIPQPILFALAGLKLGKGMFQPSQAMLPQSWDTGPSPYGITDTDMKGAGIPQPLIFNLSGLRLSQRGMFHPAKSIMASEGVMMQGITDSEVDQAGIPKPVIFALNGLKALKGGLFHPVIPNPAESPLPPYTIQGITKDKAGTPLVGFTVYLFNVTSGTPVLEQTTTSDGLGTYSFTVQQGQTYWVVDYRTGTPDKTGATLNTLTAGMLADIFAYDPTAGTVSGLAPGTLVINVSGNKTELYIDDIRVMDV